MKKEKKMKTIKRLVAVVILIIAAVAISYLVFTAGRLELQNTAKEVAYAVQTI